MKVLTVVTGRAIEPSGGLAEIADLLQAAADALRNAQVYDSPEVTRAALQAAVAEATRLATEAIEKMRLKGEQWDRQGVD
ncbi:MAG TPA: hypothetical protein EYH32_10190 [Anaerolineae bacterium]|nr:hypothetical protein [Anaerolineae bacterium]